jgi:hypothetical protein
MSVTPGARWNIVNITLADPLVALKGGAEAADYSTWILRPIAPAPGR